MWISRDGRRIIEANDGGAPISIDGGKTWDWRFNVVLAQIYRVGYDEQNPYHVCGGIQDNDSYCGPSDSLSPFGIENADWREVGNDGDGSWAWPQPGDPESIWNVGVNELNGQLGIFDLHSRQNYDISPDVIDTNGRALAGLPYRSNWEAPIAFSNNVAYYGANVLFATKDRGRTWSIVSPDLTRNDPSKQQVAGGPINTDVSGAEFYDTIFDIAPSPLQPGRIWVGTDDGLVQLTLDRGAHWRDVTPPGIQPWGRIDTVEASNADARRAYVAVDRHVMGDPRPYVLVTDDSGASWRTIVNGLPSDQYVHVVREDPANPDVLYAGSEQGVWFSLDRGARWQSLQLNMPSVAVHDMRIQPERHDLMLATHGRGFWILDDIAALSGLSKAVAASAPALFPIRSAYTWYRWWSDYYGTHPNECCLSAGAYAGENPPEGADITYYLPSATNASAEIFDAQGRRVRCFDLAGGAGVQRSVWDLTETPPVEWRHAREWNRGGAGATVVPGHYIVRLHAGETNLEQPLEVRPDPRAAWTQAQYVERYDFVTGLNDELSAIDTRSERNGFATLPRPRHLFDVHLGRRELRGRLARARPFARAADDSAGRHRALARSAVTAARAGSDGDSRSVRSRDGGLSEFFERASLTPRSETKGLLMTLKMTLVLALAFVATTVFARAGTTGGISGVVSQAGTSTPLAGVTVSLKSPSQSASTITDARGHFAFVSLAPDEYTITLDKAGYDAAVVSPASRSLPTRSRRYRSRCTSRSRRSPSVTSRSASSLVRPGTTADLYSVNAAQQERTAVLGGGGNLNSAYSAIAIGPGRVRAGESKRVQLQAVHVRGGDSYEVGYEFDGIPVNRAFDNYPSGSLSSLGQLELQVYTGATPSNAEAQGLAGFINQVIKTGTFPGYATVNPSVGTPTFYHSLNVEAGGATPDRLFSYYVGIGGYNQEHRYVDQFGGAAYANEFGQQLGSCPAPSAPTHVASFVLYQRQPERRAQADSPAGFSVRSDSARSIPANIATRTSRRQLAHRHPA